MNTLLRMRPLAAALACTWLIAVAAPLLARAPRSSPMPSESPSPLLSRVAVIGASLSSGAGMHYELGAHASLIPFLQSAIVEEAWPADAAPPLDQGMFVTFSSPVLFGSTQARAARNYEPTLVLGLDFLFWYAYGFQSPQGRMDRLEVGLAELDTFACPLLIGDLPNIEFALEGKSQLTGGPLVWRGMLPDEPTRARLNARIHAWAAERDHVTVAPLAKFVAEAFAGPDFDELIQVDRLHPTVRGASKLVLDAFETFVDARPELERAHVNWDLEQVSAGVVQRTQPARDRAHKRKERILRLRGRL